MSSSIWNRSTDMDFDTLVALIYLTAMFLFITVYGKDYTE